RRHTKFSRDWSSDVCSSDLNPAWRVGLHNEFQYRQFRLGFMFDAAFGAVGYSLTAAVNAEQGKTKNTLPGRYNGIIGNGVIDNRSEERRVGKEWRIGSGRCH